MKFDMDNNEEDDILMRFEGKNGVTLTMMTAPPETFGGNDDLEPQITGWEKQIYAIFNENAVERMIRESIETNGETYGTQAAAFLPITLIMRKAMEAATKYQDENSI